MGGAHGPELTLVFAGTIPPQLGHHFDGFKGHPAIATVAGVETEQRVVGGQRTDAHAPRIAALGHVVQVGHPVSQLHGVVVGKQMPERPELYLFCKQQRLSNQ